MRLFINTENWATVGHGLARFAVQMIGSESSHLIADVRGASHLYVQWHGEPDREFYAEAASGRYSEASLPLGAATVLLAQGWDPPLQGWAGASVENYSRHWAAPVDLYAAISLGIAALRDAFGATPSGCTFRGSLG